MIFFCFFIKIFCLEDIEKKYNIEYYKLVDSNKDFFKNTGVLNMFIDFLKNDFNYVKLYEELKHAKYQNLFLSFFPSISILFFPVLDFQSSDFDFTKIIDNFINYFFNFEKKNILYKIYNYQQQSALNFENIILKLLEIISSIRIKTRTINFLKKEIHKYQNRIHLIEDMDYLLELEDYLYDNILSLIDLENKLNETLLENNFFNGYAYIENFFYIFNYKKNHFNEKSIIFNENNKIFLKKHIPPKNLIKISDYISIVFSLNMMKMNAKLILNPLDIFYKILSNILEYKQYYFSLQESNLQWSKKIKERFYKYYFMEKKLENNKIILQKKKEQLTKLVKINKEKMKKILGEEIAILSKEEEIILQEIILEFKNYFIENEEIKNK